MLRGRRAWISFCYFLYVTATLRVISLLRMSTKGNTSRMPLMILGVVVVLFFVVLLSLSEYNIGARAFFRYPPYQFDYERCIDAVDAVCAEQVGVPEGSDARATVEEIAEIARRRSSIGQYLQ